MDRGSQDGLMLPGKMDVCPPTGSRRRHQASPCHAHTASGALQVPDCKVTRLNPPLHSPTALHGQTDRHTEIPLVCRPTGQPPGCQAGQGPLQDQLVKAAARGQGRRDHETRELLRKTATSSRPLYKQCHRAKSS